MRHFYRLIILSTFLLSSSTYAFELFIEGIDWRATETNDWAYVNSETLPQQTLDYKTIDFGYAPGFRIGASYTSTWDALLSYTRLLTTANDVTYGNIQPSFVGSVTAKPSHAYLYQSGQVHQSIHYDIFDLDFGKKFNPLSSLMIHPIVGLMGGTIKQLIHAEYQGSTSTSEKINNNFSGIGPKAGIDTSICLFNNDSYQTKLIVAFAASYLLGHWKINDVTNVNPTHTVFVDGASHSMGALTLQGMLGFTVRSDRLTIKVAYEISDWFNQNQFFDNDTGTHNNDLALQGVTMGVSYNL